MSEWSEQWERDNAHIPEDRDFPGRKNAKFFFDFLNHRFREIEAAESHHVGDAPLALGSEGVDGDAGAGRPPG